MVIVLASGFIMATALWSLFAAVGEPGALAPPSGLECGSVGLYSLFSYKHHLLLKTFVVSLALLTELCFSVMCLPVFILTSLVQMSPLVHKMHHFLSRAY